MFSTERFPERFAMLRTQGEDGPYLQVLEAESLDQFDGNVPICFFQDVSVNPNTNFQIQRTQIVDRNIYQVYSIASGVRTDEVFYYRHIPFRVRMNGEEIPILDFQYKAWLPVPRTRVLNLRNQGDNLIHAANEMSIQMSERIHAIENERTLPTPRTPPRTPPLRQATAPPRTPPPSSSALRYRPLPSNVGQILMRNARASSDSCPISYTEYSELERLSITSCFHIFDTRALESWMESGHETCPVCRERMINVVAEEIHN